jgi:hypothetical protein
MGLSLKRVADPEYADLDWQTELAEAESSFEHEEGNNLVEEDEPLYDEEDM